jgi:DNA-binding MarR family transcriptional regulator
MLAASKYLRDNPKQITCLTHVNIRVTLNTMPAQRVPHRDAAPAGQAPADEMTIAAIESALHSLARRLKQARLHDYLARQAGDGCDQAGLAILYVLRGEHALRGEEASLRITDVAARLGIDAPAVTRKAQQLERLGLVGRTRDACDARAWRLRLTPEGHRVLTQFLLARRQWLATLLADWPAADCREFARLVSRFADDVSRHLTELDC